MSSRSSADVAVDASTDAAGLTALVVEVANAEVLLRPDPGHRHVRVRAMPTEASSAPPPALEQGAFSVESSGSRLQVASETAPASAATWRRLHRTTSAVRLVIDLPSHLRVSARLPGGHLSVEGLNGALDVTAHGGGVTARALGGPVEASGSGGALAIEEATAPVNVQWTNGPVTLAAVKRPLTLKTQSAPTTVEGAQGAVDASTHAAPLTLKDLRGSCTATAHTTTLHYHGAPRSDTLLRVMDGTLTASLPHTTEADVSAVGSRVRLASQAHSDRGENGAQTVRRVNTTLGTDGGPSLTMQALPGTVECTVH
jgi:hypothetical protein